jgi:hypothetical protein
MYFLPEWPSKIHRSQHEIYLAQWQERLPTNKTPAITKTRDNFMVVSSEPQPAWPAL